jgi:hypothetical protein
MCREGGQGVRHSGETKHNTPRQGLTLIYPPPGGGCRPRACCRSTGIHPRLCRSPGPCQLAAGTGTQLRQTSSQQQQQQGAAQHGQHSSRKELRQPVHSRARRRSSSSSRIRRHRRHTEDTSSCELHRRVTLLTAVLLLQVHRLAAGENDGNEAICLLFVLLLGERARHSAHGCSTCRDTCCCSTCLHPLWQHNPGASCLSSMHITTTEGLLFFTHTNTSKTVQPGAVW